MQRDKKIQRMKKCLNSYFHLNTTARMKVKVGMVFIVAERNAGEVYFKLAKYMFIDNPTLVSAQSEIQISISW